MSDRLRTARLVAVGLLGLALFNFYALAVFDARTRSSPACRQCRA